MRLKLIPIILLLLLASTFTPALAVASDQQNQPTITTIREDYNGIYTETKPYIEGQSSVVEYTRTASATISLTSSASTSTLLAPTSSALIDAVTNALIRILEIVIGGIIVWAITSGYLKNKFAKRPPPPGIVVGIPSLRKSEVALNQVNLHCSFFAKNSYTLAAHLRNI